MAGEFVINGASLECPLCSSSGTLKVSHADVQMQDTPWATDADKAPSNLVFSGKCNNWSKNKPDCASVIKPTKWKRKADSVAVDGRLALLAASSIVCATGGVPIKISNPGQIDIPTDLPDIEEEEVTENTPPWMPIAKNEYGVEEIFGTNINNPRILEYHETTGYNSSLMGREITDDYIESENIKDPWCGSFVYWCLYESGIPEDRLFNTGYRAYDWQSWGKGVSQPGFGAIVILNRSHVAFVAGIKGDNLVILGGNQRGDDPTTYGKVCYSLENFSNVLAYRYPTDYEITENHFELEEIDTSAPLNSNNTNEF